MKKLSLITVLLFITMSVAQAGQLTPEDYTGEIVFKDGTRVEYIWLWSTIAGDKFSYSTDIEGSRSRMIRLSDVSRMDFIEMTKSGKEKATKRNWSHKAKVTFRDGTVWDNIYLSGSMWSWKSSKEEGHVRDAISITFNLKHAKKCPKCSKQFKELDWRFCPFDGTALEETQQADEAQSESGTSSEKPKAGSVEEFVYVRVIPFPSGPIATPGAYHRPGCPALERWRTPTQKIKKSGLPPEFYPCTECNP